MNRPIVVGTAGHIDHGKTALVTALTGKNTDQLKEERERGISIDIDFAPLRYDDGYVIGVVDVPGHERFIRNMVAGATGIDVALLVIDINEGVKPQTLEHISILELLGIRRGLVVLSKADLADREWREFAEVLIRQSLEGTMFSDVPFVVTSTKTNEGLPDLKETLRSVAENAVAKDSAGAFRLPVDRIFSVPGFGTVVSGTAWRGTVQLGDVLNLWPGPKTVRVRGIQVHGTPVSVARAGQRCALNITGVERGDIKRGSVLASVGTLQETNLLDVELQILGSCGRPLSHRDRVHVHLGTAEAVGRVLLLEDDNLQPGSTAVAQLLLERGIVCESADRFVIRNFSPMYTIGGGTVLDPDPARLHRRKRDDIIESLRIRRAASPLMTLVALGDEGQMWTLPRVVQVLGVTEDEAEQLLSRGTQAGEFIRLPTAHYTKRLVDQRLEEMHSALMTEHRKRRLSGFVPLSVLASHSAGVIPNRDLDWFLAAGLDQGLWWRVPSGIQASGWTVILTPEETSIYKRILEEIESAGVRGVLTEDIVRQFPRRDRVAKNLLQYGREQGFLVEIADGVWVTSASVQDTAERIYQQYVKLGPLSLGKVRDLLGISRKQALTLLEYLDKQGITERFGDERQVIKIPDVTNS